MSGLVRTLAAGCVLAAGIAGGMLAPHATHTDRAADGAKTPGVAMPIPQLRGIQTQSTPAALRGSIPETKRKLPPRKMRKAPQRMFA